MKRFHRSKSSIYRIIKARRAKSLLRRKIEFIDSDEFLQSDAKKTILGKPLAGDNEAGSTAVEPFGTAGRTLPEYLHVLKKTPVLTQPVLAEESNDAVQVMEKLTVQPACTFTLIVVKNLCLG